MIGIIGHMSGGKTYSAVADMLHRMREGHIVVSNIELNEDGVTRYLGVPSAVWRPLYWRLADEADPSCNVLSSSDYESWPCGSPRGSPTYERDKVFIYLDEVSSIFDSMTSGSSEQIKKVATWARHSEKRGQFLVLIMQFENELHKRLRVHITEYLYCKNMANVKVPILNVRLPSFLFSYVSQIRLCPDGETVIGTPRLLPLEQALFDCYTTSQIVVGSNSPIVRPDIDFDGDRDLVVMSFRVFVVMFLLCTIAGLVFLWLL